MKITKLFPISPISKLSGHITLAQWSESMEAVTNFKLPWRLLREKLAIVNQDNEIIYGKTIEMIDSDDIVKLH